MDRFGLIWRDLRIVVRAVWANLALFVAVVLAGALAMRWAGCYPQSSFLDLIVSAFHLVRLERVAAPGDGWVVAILTFVLPFLSLAFLGEGALRIIGVYVRRRTHQEEWSLLVAETFSRHTVICGGGEMGRAVCQSLIRKDASSQIVLVDIRGDALAELGLGGRNILHVHGDMTSRRCWRRRAASGRG